MEWLHEENVRPRGDLANEIHRDEIHRDGRHWDGRHCRRVLCRCRPLLNTLFASLGHDCDTYAALYSDDGKYYHQHDGFKNASELKKNCEGYAQFCPGDSCKFVQNGDALKVPRGENCYILAPYLWAELPANNKVAGNLEPHTGWEYMVSTPDSTAKFGYKINHFAETETSYSVAYNWANPADTPALVGQSTLALLKKTASKGECDTPMAPVLSDFLNKKSATGETWRQQGDAVVLAAGGICHVNLPYAAQIGQNLRTGYFVLTLQPAPSGYSISDAVDFPGAMH